MQIQISWLLQKPADVDLHWLLRQGLSCSARIGLTFSYFSTKHMLWYLLEAPHWGASNEYPQHMFYWRNRKNVSLDSLLTWCATTYKFAKTNVELMPQKLSIFYTCFLCFHRQIRKKVWFWMLLLSRAMQLWNVNIHFSEEILAGCSSNENWGFLLKYENLLLVHGQLMVTLSQCGMVNTGYLFIWKSLLLEWLGFH